MSITRKTRPRVESRQVRWRFLVGVTLFGLAFLVFGPAQTQVIRLALAQEAASSSNKEPDKLTPEQKMARRFPQPVRAGSLAGLPVLDWQDSTIGYIDQVVRTPDGKIKLIVPYAAWFGWVRNGGLLDRWRRPVPVPIEAVAILGRQLNALEMSRQDFDNAPSIDPAASSIPATETIQIAVARR